MEIEQCLPKKIIDQGRNHRELQNTYRKKCKQHIKIYRT